MARHNHPEQTVQKILEVSQNLFMEKGYDKTTIQDIINAVGMSKGVIYYHFKSKEEVFDAVMKQQFSQTNNMLLELIDNTDAANAKEKITAVLEKIAESSSLAQVDRVLLDQVKNPKFIVAGMQEAVQQDAAVLCTLVEEGQKDGSIKTEYPKEAMEVLLLLMDIWCNPILFERDKKETASRLKFIQKLMETLGIDIISDKIINLLLKGYTGGYTDNE